MSPDEYCQQKAAASGSSFYYSFLFLPPERRRAITALYAFCREVDDVVDEVSDPGVARTKLAWWRQEIGAIYAGTPQHPVAQALVPVVRTLRAGARAPRADHRRHGDGSRLQPLPRLRRPCRSTAYRVAGVVGDAVGANLRLHRSAHAGVRANPRPGLPAHQHHPRRRRGRRRNRIYLPLDELARFDLTTDDLVALEEDERFLRLMAFQIERARNATRAPSPCCRRPTARTSARAW